jgi:hypothetical protein
MSKIKMFFMSAALLLGVGAAFASTNAARFATQFYVDNGGNRINTVYPSLGICSSSTTQNCHAPYEFNSTTQQWVLSGAIVKGVKPF